MRQQLTEGQIVWLRENNRGFARTEEKFGAPRREYVAQREQYADRLELDATEARLRLHAQQVEVLPLRRPSLPAIARHTLGVAVVGALAASAVYWLGIWPER
ncbi:MAG: hypothetical protein ACREIB_09695 [Pseudomonadota bacterium]